MFELINTEQYVCLISSAALTLLPELSTRSTGPSMLVRITFASIRCNQKALVHSVSLSHAGPKAFTTTLSNYDLTAIFIFPSDGGVSRQDM